MTEAELYLAGREDRLVILDEARQVPELFPVLRSHRRFSPIPRRFLLLGSASPDLINLRRLEKKQVITNWARRGKDSSSISSLLDSTW